MNYRASEQAARECAATIKAAGGEAVAVKADIARAGDRGGLVDRALETFGRIDLLVNNAGAAPRKRTDVLDMTEESFDEVLAVNLRGPFFLTQRVAGEMIRLVESGTVKDPMIVNISSVSAYASSTNRAEYCIAKAGLSMMTRLYADRLAESGINVYEIRPGIIETDMTSAVKDKYDDLIAGGLTPIRRWGQPEDVARAVVAIAEGSFPFSTGETFNVDGGFHIRRL